jgi:hypothetical protein
MGASSYSDEAASRLYGTRSALKANIRSGAATAATFKSTSHTAVIDAGMDPATIKIRESRDSAAHPNSNAIMVAFDVTGSMGGIPANLALDKDKLPGLMRLITTHSYIEDPQILFGAVGDAYSDRSPLQVGQFESGLEMDDWLTKIFLEGGGGGTRRESYELAYLWAANHVSMDCFEKRGKKGYLFTMGDEMAYEKIPRNVAKKVLGDDMEADLTLEQVLAKANEKFEVFHIYVNEGSYADSPEHIEFWKKHLGERFLMLKDVKHIAELIGSTIGVCEGRGLDDVAGDLAKAGLDASAAAGVTDAIVPYSRARGTDLAKTGTTTGALPATTGGAATRL